MTSHFFFAIINLQQLTIKYHKIYFCNIIEKQIKGRKTGKSLVSKRHQICQNKTQSIQIEI
jgi:hypothetical protein